MQISNVEELKAWIATGGVPDYLYFWGHTPAQPQVPDKSCFSQWFPSPFSLAGVTYATAEHYMMAQKAALFGDTAVQARIVAAARPSEVKKLGREVANFDAKVWEAARAGIVFDGVADALAVPDTDVRLFGKPESFVKRRMGVALAHAADVETARERAKEAASRVKPRRA